MRFGIESMRGRWDTKNNPRDYGIARTLAWGWRDWRALLGTLWAVQTVQYSIVTILRTVNLLPWSYTPANTRSTRAAKPLLSSVDLFACSMKTFNDLAIFLQGSRLYGRLDFANSIFFVSLVFGQRQTWPVHFKYWLSETVVFCYM